MRDGMIMQYLPYFLLIVLCGLVLSGCSTLKSAKPWHRIILDEEFAAKDAKPSYRWEDYLAQETRLFAQLQKMLEENPHEDAYRYQFNSPLNALTHTHNWNRSFVLKPEKIRAGIVMLHGLSDSPYSVRSLALHLQQQGFYVIAARLPGHGTLPTGLLGAQWEDWAAVTELAVKELQQQLGNNNNIYLLGYSTGAALAVNYALDAQKDKQLPQPKKLILLSPMFGVSKFASFSKSLELLARLPFFSAKRWLSKMPEYNPFKYNSFAVNAGWQAHRLTKHLMIRIQAKKLQNELAGFPPTLSFQSLVDSTVSTAAIEEYFYRALPKNKSELVIFDINRQHNLVPITRTDSDELLVMLFKPAELNYDLVKISNTNPSTEQVSEWRRPAGTLDNEETPLPLEYPRGVYSLSHIALPFPLNDPTYGLDPDEKEFYGIRLGNLNLRGEKNTLILAADVNQRLNANPFYRYMEQRIDEWLEIKKSD